MTTAPRSIFRGSSVGTTADRGARGIGRRRQPVRLAAALLSSCVLLGAVPAGAQTVRSLPGAEEAALADARARLAKNAGDVAALRDAVQAAMRLGDIEVAALYATRAQQLAPKDAVITAARAAIEVQRGRPREGLALFAKADAGGAAQYVFAADRALGYDLVGDQPSAQFFYAMAQRQSPDDEVLRRYALSLAISGDYATGSAMLRPLLNVRDRPAARINAFMLAIDGRAADAKRSLAGMVPDSVAQKLGPYLDAMPRLSRAQQAAAANLGLFPALALARPAPASAPAAPARSAALVPPPRSAQAKTIAPAPVRNAPIPAVASSQAKAPLPKMPEATAKAAPVLATTLIAPPVRPAANPPATASTPVVVASAAAAPAPAPASVAPKPRIDYSFLDDAPAGGGSSN